MRGNYPRVTTNEANEANYSFINIARKKGSTIIYHR